jgi:tRNA-dihydrouridine synthase
MKDHLDLMCEFYGAHLGVTLFRKHLARYLMGRLPTSEIRTWIFNIESQPELNAAMSSILAAKVTP